MLRLALAVSAQLAWGAGASPPATEVGARPIRTGPPSVRAEETLEQLIELALERNRDLRAAVARAEASRARVTPAGTVPDPVLTVGVRSFAPAGDGFGDPMAHRVVGVRQTLPYPGKLSAMQTAAAREADAAEAALEAVRRDVIRRVKRRVFELAYLDAASEIVARHVELLEGFSRAVTTRLATGTAGQDDVLKARVELARLSDEASRLEERRRQVVAFLNALLDRDPETPVGAVTLPEHVAAALRTPEDGLRFMSPVAGGRLAHSPVPDLASLQDRAVESDPGVRRLRALLKAEDAREAFARRSHLPDVTVDLGYGQRGDRADLFSLLVSIPLPVHPRARQAAWVREAESRRAARDAEYASYVAALRSRVAELHAELERLRTHAGILASAMIPQAGAALQAASAGFQVGRTDFLTLLTHQVDLFRYELNLRQAMTEFAQALADLEAVVGKEILK